VTTTTERRRGVTVLAMTALAAAIVTGCTTPQQEIPMTPEASRDQMVAAVDETAKLSHRPAGSR
jgi:uncharacterized lipoprotein YajG